jgi:hypothetical protein
MSNVSKEVERRACEKKAMACPSIVILEISSVFRLGDF